MGFLPSTSIEAKVHKFIGFSKRNSGRTGWKMQVICFGKQLEPVSKIVDHVKEQGNGRSAVAR
jgi:hypothetical protein